MKTSGNVGSLLGRWLNTSRDTRGIAECVVAQDDEAITVSIKGADNESWPKARATVLANVEEEAGQRTIALLADFDLGFLTVETHIRVNKGVLVIVLYATFRDGSGQSNYLNREFFYRST
jgi:ABC-type xylose transport system substrate-binding protein